MAPGRYVTGLALAFGAVLLFSLKSIFAKFAYAEGLDAISILGLRMALTLPVFAAVALWVRRSSGLPPLSRRDFWQLMGLGIIGYYLSSLLDFMGLQYVSASLERLLLFSYPTMVVLLSAIFYKRRVTARDVVSLAVTYAGVAMVVAGAESAELSGVFLGAAYVVSSAVLYAIYLLVGAELLARAGTVRFTAYCMVVSAIPGILQWIALRGAAAFDMSRAAFFWAVMLAVVSTIVPIFMQSAGLKRLGANQFSIIGALGPVATIVIGYVFLGERMTAVQWAGALAVVTGVMIVSLKPSR